MSLNPATGKRYRRRFSAGHRRGLGGGRAGAPADHLGIGAWAAVVGGSVGMQALEWTLYGTLIVSAMRW